MKVTFNHTSLKFIILALALAACKATTHHNDSLISLPQASLPRVITIPVDTSQEFYHGVSQKVSVSWFYDARQGRPAWSDKVALSDSLIDFLSTLRYYGLPPSRYHFAELRQTTSTGNDAEKVRRDILLTDALVLLALELKTGISNHEKGVDSIRIELLNSVLKEGNLSRMLQSQEPDVNGYIALKKGLRNLLDSQRTGERDSMQLQRLTRLIAINLERWRKENSLKEGRFVLVNIPAFTLDVVEGDSIILSSRVIVGDKATKTPVFSSVIECISIYPYWHVPRKIAVEEYLPVIQKDTTFITMNNFDVIDRKGKILHPDSVPWHRFGKNYFPVSLRQREGPSNALGVIKFIFDNPYAVFLHDTNAKRLFNNENRALSHGCVRMEKAVEFAHFLVTGRIDAESKMLSKYLSEKQQRWIDLKDPIPIHLRYFTCEFRDGRLFEYHDVYALDAGLNILFGEVGAF